MVRSLKIYFLISFQITIVTIPHITFPEFVHLITGYLYLLTIFTHFPPPCYPLLLETTLIGFFTVKYSLQACVPAQSFPLDFLQPCGLEPARLLCPWGFPGKNTGVGSHSTPGDLPDPGTEPWSPSLQADSLLFGPPVVVAIGTRLMVFLVSEKSFMEVSHLSLTLKPG